VTIDLHSRSRPQYPLYSIPPATRRRFSKFPLKVARSDRSQAAERDQLHWPQLGGLCSRIQARAGSGPPAGVPPPSGSRLDCGELPVFSNAVPSASSALPQRTLSCVVTTASVVLTNMTPGA
jgi:hypothetical protein